MLVGIFVSYSHDRATPTDILAKVNFNQIAEEIDVRREDKKREEKRRRKRREGERERDSSSFSASSISLPSVLVFSTPLCILSKRLRVFPKHARMCPLVAAAGDASRHSFDTLKFDCDLQETIFQPSLSHNVSLSSLLSSLLFSPLCSLLFFSLLLVSPSFLLPAFLPFFLSLFVSFFLSLFLFLSKTRVTRPFKSEKEISKLNSNST